MSNNTTSNQMGLAYEHGVGFSENDGFFPTPETQTGLVKIIDTNDMPHLLILDMYDGKFYDVTTRDGPIGSNIKKYFKDKVNIDGSGGYDISPEVMFREDTGIYEKYLINHQASRFYVRPDFETNRGISGFDYNGYISGTVFTAEVFVDGEPNVATASSEQLDISNEINYDKSIEGHRIQTKFSSNNSGFRLLGRQQDYVVKNISYNPSGVSDFENYQQDLSTPSLWYTRSTLLDTDIVSGVKMLGANSNLPLENLGSVSGPDGKAGSAPLFDSSVYIPVLLPDHSFIMFWSNDTPDVSSMGNTINFLTFGSRYMGWNLYYMYNLTGINNLQFNNSGVQLFDIRVYSDSIYQALPYYYNDVIKNNANNVCPVF